MEVSVGWMNTQYESLFCLLLISLLLISLLIFLVDEPLPMILAMTQRQLGLVEGEFFAGALLVSFSLVYLPS